jgi:iron(III) transport system substrate-binding protein
MRLLLGEDEARAWLEGMIANEPKVFDGNAPIVQAVAAGEFQVGLVNHYYLYNLQKSEGTTLPVANHFFAAGDVGSLVNIAGVGVLTSAANTAQANAFVDYLLSPAAQAYFATETSEYPLIADVPAPEGFTPLAEIEAPDVDLTDLDDLEGTLALLTDVGLL